MKPSNSENTAAPEDRPIDPESFDRTLAQYIPDSARAIAVAVSGGADSMALALLTADWCQASGRHMVTATVDHKLRPESTAEAQLVADWMAALGIRHRCLTWHEGTDAADSPASLETAARVARYRMLTEWCVEEGIDYLLLAHHADDQIETFWMRLARGSGLNGLAAMRPVSRRNGIALVRPLLDFAKARLVATCRARKQRWIEDSSNADPRNTRTRFRQAQALLTAEGLSRERLLATIAHMGRAQDAIGVHVEALHRAACIWNAFGVATLDANRLKSAPREVALRVLADILTAAAGAEYGPRFEALAAALDALSSAETCTRTLHGCVMSRAGGAMTIFREAGRLTASATFSHQGKANWDGRFRVVCSGFSESDLPARFSVEPLTNDIWIALKRDQLAQDLSTLPAAVRQTLPVVRDAAGIAAIPHAGFTRSDLTRQGLEFGVEWIGRKREPLAEYETVPETS
ncbi:MAG: tRNA lysidine(34) synthetase TilS [Rhodobacteraceae bacterium]|nr:tRNA lysidine(34) synthetase TilS [Paracoccaceae bacterium]